LYFLRWTKYTSWVSCIWIMKFCQEVTRRFI
jgi:hypothetical protein